MFLSDLLMFPGLRYGISGGSDMSLDVLDSREGRWALLAVCFAAISMRPFSRWMSIGFFADGCTFPHGCQRCSFPKCISICSFDYYS